MNYAAATEVKISMSVPRGKSPRRRFAEIESDLDTLCRAWGGTIPQGLRNTWLHLYATWRSHQIPAGEFEAEIVSCALAATPTLSPAEMRSIVCSAVRCAETAGSELPGSPGRLHCSGATMVEMLDVDDATAERLNLKME